MATLADTRAGEARRIAVPFVRGLAAGAAAILAMTALTAAALALAGARQFGELRPLVAALVALAAGGRTDVTLSISGKGGGLSGLGGLGGLGGSLQAMPLGITLTGVVVLAALLLHDHRRETAPGLAARAVGAVTSYLALLVTAASLGHGTIARPATSATPPPATPSGPGGLLAGDHSLATLLADGRTLEYTTAVGGTALRGCLLVLGVLLVCWLLSHATPGLVRDLLRPALSAVTTVLLAGATLVILAGLVAATAFGQGGKGLAAVLLAAPNAVVIGWSSGLGVPWTINATGVFGGKLPTGGGSSDGPGFRGLPGGRGHSSGSGLLGGSDEWPRPLIDSDTAALTMVIVAILLTLACGMLTAARSTPPGAPTTLPRRALWNAGALGGVLSLALLILVLVAGATGGIVLSVLGFSVPAVTFQVDGGWWQAILGGLLGGAAGGAAGTMLLAAVRRVRGAH
ncbi:streptophobe family protein [Micromonospora sp. NPDC049175]|uniref:streptophobe family protein n=1 Tax=Micromonospora sp. NPDC049175 TaxID=3364266 RepID=UPI0037147B16